MEGVQKDNSHDSNVDEQGLPPQHHAGRVGLGPNYNPDPTVVEIIDGLKEELKGKIKHDPKLVKHGREIRSGEEKRKKITGEDESNPFQVAKQDDSEDKNESSKPSGPGSPSQGRDAGTPKNGSPDK